MGAHRPGCGGYCLLLSRSLFERIGGFDEELWVAEDHDLVHRAARHGRFRMLRAVRLVLSTRRVRREGALRFAIRVVLTELYLIIRPRIPPTSIFSNEFWDRRTRAQRNACR